MAQRPEQGVLRAWRFLGHATPGTGQVDWAGAFKTLAEVGYDGWMVIEAFGRALPDLAAATKVWRDLFPSDVEVYTQGLRFMKQMWNKYR